MCECSFFENKSAQTEPNCAIQTPKGRQTHEAPNNLRALYSLSQVANLLGVSPGAVRARARRGQIRVFQHGPRGKRFVLLSDLRGAYPDLWDALLVKVELEEMCEA